MSEIQGAKKIRYAMHKDRLDAVRNQLGNAELAEEDRIRIIVQCAIMSQTITIGVGLSTYTFNLDPEPAAQLAEMVIGGLELHGYGIGEIE